MASPVEEYLRRLRQELRHDPLLRRRVLEEARDHLYEIVAEQRRNGMSEEDAEGAAVSLLLMGIILAGHGLVAFAHTAPSAAIARRITAH